MSNHKAEVNTGGFGGFLAAANLNIVEFAICAGFWATMWIISNFISINMVLASPPVALVITVLSFIGDYASMIGSIGGLMLLAYFVYACRDYIVKVLRMIVRKGRR